jgi:colicin import membrane protein
VISIFVIGKAVAASKRTPSATQMPVATVVEPAREPPAPVQEAIKTPAPEAAKPAPEPAKVDEKKADEPAKAGEPAKVDEKKADEKKPDEPAKADEPPKPAADAVALKKETESLLNRGKNKEAIEKAREAIAADPTDAMPYLYLGSALQDTGKWKDGIEAYCECVRNATKGPINDCRAVGGHK